MSSSGEASPGDTTLFPGVLIHADVGWCRKQARRAVLRGCGIFAFCWVVIAIDVWFNLIDLRNEGAWTVCGLGFGMLVLMGAVLTIVWLWSFRDVVILSPRQLWAGSAMGRSQDITFDDIGALTIERDEKRNSWILRNAAVARRAVRVPIEAYPVLYQQIHDFKNCARDENGDQNGPTP